MKMESKEVRGLMEAYASVYVKQEEVEQLDETRTDPRGRPASGPMSVYGGRGQDAGPGGSGNANVDRMDAAQRRVKATQPAAKGRAADSLHTKYSARQKGMEHGGEEGPGPKSPKRGGRSGRAANTDRGSGNAAARRMREEFEGDLFNYILEHLVAEGYADTNKAALAIMANMSEDWKQDIVEAKYGTEAGRKKLAKKIRKGEEIGKSGPGTGFKAVEKAAEKGGAEDPKAVAAAAMWKTHGGKKG